MCSYQLDSLSTLHSYSEHVSIFSYTKQVKKWWFIRYLGRCSLIWGLERQFWFGSLLLFLWLQNLFWSELFLL